jgi:hypothetical protein
MNMLDFKVGDKVKCKPRVFDPMIGHISHTGTVVHVKSSETVGVDWGQSLHAGHDCEGHCKSGQGWYFVTTDLILVKEKIEQKDQEDVPSTRRIKIRK